MADRFIRVPNKQVTCHGATPNKTRLSAKSAPRASIPWHTLARFSARAATAVGAPIGTTLDSKGKFRLEVPQARMKVLRQFNVPARAWDGSCRDELLNEGRLTVQGEGVSSILIPEES